MKKTIIRRKPTTTLNATELHPILKKIYENRGIKHIDEINRELKTLIPFHHLKNIDIAVKILYEQLQNQKKILIVGDFDADGATSTAVGVKALKAFGAKKVDFLVPNRFEYGYGLTPEIVVEAAKRQPDLIITVDNGISSIAGVEAAKDLNIPVLITDHHLPGRELPDAAAMVNPNLVNCPFPSKNLAGVGVIFYVMCALRRYLEEHQWFELQSISAPNMSAFLDLVALGTVADVVPLDQNNRILVHQGLKRIRAGYCSPGILAILEIANRNYQNLTAVDLGFILGPRLNAAGRLDDMSLGIHCLLSDSVEKAREYALVLNDLNDERKAIEMEMKEQALEELNHLKTKRNDKLPLGFCLYDESWHQGVIGILASRIKDHYHRPVIAFAPGENNILKGSARSIHGLHIRDILDAVATKHPHLITKFGGHAMAAGLSINLQDLPEFTVAFEAQLQSQITEGLLKQEIYSDGELKAEHFNVELAHLLQQAGPWGQHFPEPIFDGEFKIISQRIVGRNHLKCVLQCDNGLMIDAIRFNVDLDKWPNHRCDKIKIAYKLDVNEYQGIKSLQLRIEWINEEIRRY